jgi:hypothetical protein
MMLLEGIIYTRERANLDVYSLMLILDPQSRQVHDLRTFIS